MGRHAFVDTNVNIKDSDATNHPKSLVHDRRSLSHLSSLRCTSFSTSRISNNSVLSDLNLSSLRSSISGTSWTMQRFVCQTDSFVTRFLAANCHATTSITNYQTPSPIYETSKHVFRSGIRSFHAATSTTERKCTMAYCKSVKSTLEDAMKAISADTSRSYQHLEQVVGGANLVANARVLEIIKGRTRRNPNQYVGIKQVVYRSLLDANSFEEFVMLETIDTGVNPDGFKYTYKVLRSIPEEVQHESGLYDSSFDGRNTEYKHVTGNMHSLVVLLTECATPNVLQLQVWLDVEVSRLGNNDPLGSFSTYHDASSLAARYRELIESVNVISSTVSAHVAKVCVASISRRRKWCHLCIRRVGFPFRRRMECGVCGSYVCSQCAERMEWIGVRVCSACKRDTSRAWCLKKYSSKTNSLRYSIRNAFNLSLPTYKQKDARASDYLKGFRNYRAVVEQSEDDVWRSQSVSEVSTCSFALQSVDTSDTTPTFSAMDDDGGCNLLMLRESERCSPWNAVSGLFKATQCCIVLYPESLACSLPWDR